MIRVKNVLAQGTAWVKGLWWEGALQCLGGCEVSVVAVERAGTRGRLAWPSGARRSRACKERSGCGQWREGSKEGVVV